MDSTFLPKQIIWAKVRGYPWWPAEIVKLPNQENKVFKVIFIAQDNHAYLQPKDVKKYLINYDEFSKKKMKGLTEAIDVADQINKKRIQIINKNAENNDKNITQANTCVTKKGRIIRKTKFLNKRKIKKGQDLQNESISGNQIEDNLIADDVESIDLEDVRERKIDMKENKQKRRRGRRPKVQEEQGEEPSKEMQQMEDEKEEIMEQIEQMPGICWSKDQIEEEYKSEEYVMESEQKIIDRSKIDKIEEYLLERIDEIKMALHTNQEQHIFQYMTQNSLTGEELLQSKITNMLGFIIHQCQNRKDTNLVGMVDNLSRMLKSLKERIIEYLEDTSYYDQHLKTVFKNKKNRVQFEQKVNSLLKSNYKMKKEVAETLALRLGREMMNGVIKNEKELLDDLKEKRMDLSLINNKVAIERAIDTILLKYR